MDELINAFKDRHPQWETIVLLMFTVLLVFSFRQWGVFYKAFHSKSIADDQLKPAPIPWPLTVGLPIFLISQLFVSSIAFFLMTLTLVPWTLHTAGISPLHQWFPKNISFRYSIGIGLTVCFAMLIPLQLSAALNMLSCQWLNIPVSEQPAVNLFLQTNDSVKIGLFAFYACIAAPVTEEVLFRGFLQSTLKNHVGGKRALWATSIIFSLIHHHPPTFLPLLLLGLALGKAQEATGSLLPSICLHAAFNTCTVFFILLIRYG